MTVYGQKNINCLFLSPYVQVQSKGEKTICYNAVKNQTTCLDFPAGLLSVLNGGITYEEFISHLKNCNFPEETAEKIIKLMLQRGIVE